MAAPYVKRNDSDAIDDGWTITDGDGEVIAHLQTETMADCLMAGLVGDAPKPENYTVGKPIGELDV